MQGGYSRELPAFFAVPDFGGIFLRVVRLAFGCWHRHISRPFTLRGRTYEICLDCGKELPYSLELMSRVKELHFAATKE